MNPLQKEQMTRAKIIDLTGKLRELHRELVKAQNELRQIRKERQKTFLAKTTGWEK